MQVFTRASTGWPTTTSRSAARTLAGSWSSGPCTRCCPWTFSPGTCGSRSSVFLSVDANAKFALLFRNNWSTGQSSCISPGTVALRLTHCAWTAYFWSTLGQPVQTTPDISGLFFHPVYGVLELGAWTSSFRGFRDMKWDSTQIYQSNLTMVDQYQMANWLDNAGKISHGKAVGSSNCLNGSFQTFIWVWWLVGLKCKHVLSAPQCSVWNFCLSILDQGLS